jgi:cobalt-zinc-cadmium efflux system outer membrane protein
MWAALFASSQARAGVLRLADVLERVAASPDQAAARAEVPVAQADVTTARMWPNPALVVGGERAEPIFSAAVQLRLPILGQRGAHVRAAERAVEQAEASVGVSAWRLRHDARIAYYTAARAEEEVRIADEVEGLTRRVAEMAAERFEVGTGTRLGKDQAALLHVRAEQDISDRRAGAITARLELARLLGVSEGALGALGDGLAAVGGTPELQMLAAASRARHPELNVVQLERESALERARAARADRRPVPTVELGVDLLSSSCGANALCPGPRGGLSFDLPLFNLNRGPIDRAEAEARVAEAKARAVRVRLDAALHAAYATFTAATIRARFFDTEYEPAAERVEAMAREGFTTGKTGLLPLIEAERAVLEARLGRANALFAVHAARADLEEASGVPLSAP